LLILVPFAGIGQSARKINSALKLEHASVLRSYDSILRINDSLDDVYMMTAHVFMKVRNGFFKKTDEERNAREEVLSLYRKLELLGIAKSMAINFQTLDTIKIPYNFKLLEETISPQNGIKKVEKKTFELRLDDLSNKEQNELLAGSISEIKQTIVFVQTVNSNLLSNLPQLESKRDELLRASEKLDAFTTDLNNKIDYLHQQKQLARSAFVNKGPKGFNDNYFRTFPDVFPDNPLSQEMINEEFIDFGEEVIPMPEPDRRDEVYSLVDESADFPGGIAKLKEYMKANLMYPETALELGIEGKCYLQFIVSAKGNISNVKVIRGIPDCPECDKEAIRLTKAMPNWTPGKINGEPVNSLFNIPISFKLP